MIARVRKWWLSTVIFEADDRALLYRALAAQIRAGTSPQTAFERLASTFRISPEMVIITRAAAAAAAEGRLAFAGAQETGYLPDLDVQLLQLAEHNNKLPDACEQLLNRLSEKLNFLQSVLVPNLYYLIIAVILLFMSAQAADIANSLPLNQANFASIPAFRWALFIQAYWPFMLIISLGLIVFVIYGRTNFGGKTRHALLLFDTEYRHQITAYLAELGMMLYRQGVTHLQYLDATAATFGHDPFVYRGVITAKNNLVAEGMTLEESLKNCLITKEAAATLAALVPGGETNAYPRAFETVCIMEKAKLKKLYLRCNQSLKMFLLLLNGVLILLLAHGFYTTIITQ